MAWNDNPSGGRSGWGQQPQWGSRPPRRDGWGAPPPPPRYPQQPRDGWGQSQGGPPQFMGEGRRLPNLDLPLGTKCKVLTSKDNIVVTIIKVGREQYEVRMPDLTIGWFYGHELEPINE